MAKSMNPAPHSLGLNLSLSFSSRCFGGGGAGYLTSNNTWDMKALGNSGTLGMSLDNS
jgi:hypothetical protein